MTHGSPSHQDCRNAAHVYRDHNLSVIPFKLSYNPTESTISKHPVLTSWKEFQSRLPTHEEIDSWFNRFPESCVAIVTGRISGITVLDVDKGASSQHYTTLTADTINGGRHHFFRYAAVGNRQDIYSSRTPETPHAAGVDVRCDGGLIVASPSFCNTPDGYRRYKFSPLSKFSKENLDNLQTFPEDILAKINVSKAKQSSATSSRNWSQINSTLTAGARHKTLLQVVGTVVARLPVELAASVGYAGVLDWNERYCVPPKERAEIDKMFSYCIQKREEKLLKQAESGWVEAKSYQDEKFKELNEQPF